MRGRRWRGCGSLLILLQCPFALRSSLCLGCPGWGCSVEEKSGKEEGVSVRNITCKHLHYPCLLPFPGKQWEGGGNLGCQAQGYQLP